MILKERAGPVTDQQRKLLEEADKSCARIADLLAQISELSQLEEGAAKFNRGTVDLTALLADAIAALPPLADREIAVQLQPAPATPVIGDAGRLARAFSSILWALRRELVSNDALVVVVWRRPAAGLAQVTVAEASRIQILTEVEPTESYDFDEWRGGVGLSLSIARRIIEAHGGSLLSPDDQLKGAAIILLPLAVS